MRIFIDEVNPIYNYVRSVILMRFVLSLFTIPWWWSASNRETAYVPVPGTRYRSYVPVPGSRPKIK
jgi:hypothetical protein